MGIKFQSVIFAAIVKKLITIFLLLIICVQCLPVKELGKCIFESSFVEEDVCDKSVDKKETKDYSKEFCFNDYFHLLNASEKSKQFRKLNTHLFSCHVADVTTPPPNAFSI